LKKDLLKNSIKSDKKERKKKLIGVMAVENYNRNSCGKRS
jgi:hypothetical protein